MDEILHDLKVQMIRKDDWDDDPNGRLLIWERPDKLCKYIVGVDVATGVGLTNSVAHVVRVGTVYEPFEQVAEFACNFIDPHAFAPILDLIGRMYSSRLDELPAMMCIECNNAGESTQYDLMTIYGYPNIYNWKVYDRSGNVITNKLGWWTTPRTRRKIVVNGSRLLKSGMWKINSPWFIDEMADFELQKGIGNMMLDTEIEIASGKHAAGALDDRLMAGFIAVWCANDLHDGTDILVEHQRHLEHMKEQETRLNAGQPRKDYQNSSMSYDKMKEMEDI